MKCIIIGHEFAEANTGNLYCKLEVRPANDEWAASFNYVMFITDAMKTALEAKFPKEIYLQEIRMQTPEPFNRVWATDGNNHMQGEIVCNAKGDPIVFNDIKVVIRTLPDSTPARGEDAEKLLESSWRRGIENGTILPIGEGTDVPDNNIGQTVGGADAFAGAQSAGDPESLETSQPDPLPTGNVVVPGNRPQRPQQQAGIRVPRV